MDGELILRVDGDVLMVADLADPSGRTLAAAGLWEWNVGAAIQRILRPGDVFMDVGANTGYYSVLAARLVGPQGHVYALEPAPRTYAVLQRNVALNGFGNRVSAIEAAAGAERGSATLFGPALGHDASSSLRRQPDATSKNATMVDVQPLCDVLAPEHRDGLRLVKIDVEGHEDDVLVGLEPALTDGPLPTLIVEVHAEWNPGAARFVLDFCARHGYRAHWIAEDTGSADEGLAPVDRELVLEDVGDPPDLSRIRRARYALLLEAR